MSADPDVLLAAFAICALATAGSIFIGNRLAWRAATARNAEFRALFTVEPPIDPSIEVEVLCADGTRCLAWHRPPVGWIDVNKLIPIEGAVLGWRKPPFAEEDVSDWSRDRIKAELERRFPQAE